MIAMLFEIVLIPKKVYTGSCQRTALLIKFHHVIIPCVRRPTDSPAIFPFDLYIWEVNSAVIIYHFVYTRQLRTVGPHCVLPLF